MTIRPDIAALIHTGHTDASIAHRLGCHRSTAHRTRQLLGVPPVRTLDRLAAEAAPVPIRNRHREPLTPEQTTANRAALAAAIYRGPRRKAAA